MVHDLWSFFGLCLKKAVNSSGRVVSVGAGRVFRSLRSQIEKGVYKFLHVDSWIRERGFELRREGPRSPYFRQKESSVVVERYLLFLVVERI